MQKVIQFCAIPVHLQAGDKSTPKFSMTAYTGGLMMVAGFDLPVVVDLDGLNIDRQSVPIRLEHQVGQGVGHTTDIQIVDGQLFAAGLVSRKTDWAKDVADSGKEGFPWQASIGAQVLDYQFVPESESVTANGQTFEGPCYHVTQSVLKEISFVESGADNQTSATITANQKGTSMPHTATQERKRIETIRATVDRFQSLLPAEDLRQIEGNAIEAEWDTNETVETLLNRMELHNLRNSRPQAPVISGRQRISASATDVLSAAALMLYGHHSVAEESFNEQTLQAAADLRVNCALNLCSAALTLNMADVPNNQNDMIRASFSSGSLPLALSNSATKMLEKAYKAAPQTWRAVGAIRPTKNFHPHSAIRGVLKDGIYKPIGDGGEIKHANLAEEGMTYQSDTRGLMFSVTRKTIINDDLNLIFDLQYTLGINAARTVNKIFWETLRNLQTFFSVAKKNYAEGATTALGIDSLSMAIKLLREQVDGDNNPVGTAPKVLVVPPYLEPTARAILASIEVNQTGDNAPTANPWKNLNLELVVEPYLGAAVGGSDNGWYLFGQKSITPAMLVSFLNGKDSPTVETTDVDFNKLGQQFRAYLDFGVDTGDCRGAIKMKGAA